MALDKDFTWLKLVCRLLSKCHQTPYYSAVSPNDVGLGRRKVTKVCPVSFHAQFDVSQWFDKNKGLEEKILSPKSKHQGEGLRVANLHRDEAQPLAKGGHVWRKKNAETICGDSNILQL